MSSATARLRLLRHILSLLPKLRLLPVVLFCVFPFSSSCHHPSAPYVSLVSVPYASYPSSLWPFSFPSHVHSSNVILILSVFLPLYVLLCALSRLFLLIPPPASLAPIAPCTPLLFFRPSPLRLLRVFYLPVSLFLLLLAILMLLIPLRLLLPFVSFFTSDSLPFSFASFPSYSAQREV